MAERIGLEAVLETKNFSSGLNTYLKGIGQMDKQTAGIGSKIGGAFAGIGKSVLSIGAIAGGVALAGIGALATGIAAAGAVSIKTAISFESAFAGVLKTTDGLTDSTGKLNQVGEELRQGFVNLSKEVPLTFEELAAIGELGGQLGIGKEALLDFTETITALGVSTNLTTEEAATAIAQLGNIYQVAAGDMGTNTQKVGSTIVALGNNFATTERDILAFASRIAGAGQIAGLSQADILGIGTAMSSVGVQAEAGGTAVQKVLLSINEAVVGSATGFVDNTTAIENNVAKMQDLNAVSARLEAQSPGLQAQILGQYDAFIQAGGSADEFGRQLGDKTVKSAFDTALALRELQAETDLLRQSQGKPIDPKQLQLFAQTAGLSANEFKQAWEQDAAGAFQLFVEGLGEQGDGAIATLEELGLTDQRLTRSFLSLAGAGDLLGRTMDKSNEAWIENTALANEAAQRYATTESKLAILKNQFRAVADSIGTRLLPLFNRLIDFGSGLIEKWAGPLADVIDNVVLPAIDGFIGKIGDLITTFQAGGLFGSASGSFGSKGLLAALGIPANYIDIIHGVFNGIQQVIDDFASGGIMAALGGAGGGGGISVILSALGLGDSAIQAVEGFLLRIKKVLLGFSVKEIFGGTVTAGDVAGGILAVLGLNEGVITTVQTTIDNIISAVSNAIGNVMNTIGFGGTGGQVAGAFLVGLGITPDVAMQVQIIVDQIIGFIQQIPTFISQAFSFISANIEIFKGALLGIGGVLLGGAVLGALVAVGTFILGLLTPINLIIVGAALLGAAWAGNWGNIQGITMTVVNAVVGILGVLADTFTSVIWPQIQMVITNLTNALGAAGLSWGDVWTAIQTAVVIVAAAIGAAILGIISVITALVSGIASGLATATGYIEQFGAFFTMWIEGAATTFAGFINLFNALIAGDWAAAWDSMLMIADGIGQSLTGIFGLIVTAFQAGLATALSFVTSFYETVVQVFMDLYNAVVGNSIIPDLVQGVIDWLTQMVTSITSIFGGIAETVSGFFTSLFGGGESAAPEFDVTAIQEGLTIVNQLVNQINTGLTNISTVTLLLFTEATMVTISAITPLWQQVIQLLEMVDMILMRIANVALPLVMTSTMTTTAAMIAGFNAVNAVLQQTVALLKDIIKELDNVTGAIEDVTEAIEELGDENENIEDMIDLLQDATNWAEKLAFVLTKVVSAMGGVGGALTGLGYKGGKKKGHVGMGFAMGTEPLGYLVPPGYPNDTFPINVTSGERVVVSPPGRSIEEVVAPRMMRMMAGMLGPRQITVQVGPNNISNGMDLAMVEQVAKNVVQGL